jgi:leucine dehydrogenase
MLLHEAGARLTVTDIDPAKVALAVKELGATPVSPDDIYDVEADIFCPCGLGAIINPSTIGRLRCAIIAGSANNQLSEDAIGEELYQRGILYAPDYLINSGGLMFVALQHARHHEQAIRQKVSTIYDALIQLYKHADADQLPTSHVADIRAEAIIHQASLKAHQAA